MALVDNIDVAIGDLDAAGRLLDENPRLSSQMVQLLLESGADPNVLSGSSWAHRPLHRTVEHKVATPKHEGYRRTVEVPMAAGANPVQRAAIPPMTAIALAAIAGGTQFLPLLIGRHSSLDTFDAAAIGDASRLKELLKKDRALAAAVDVAGCDALWYASVLCRRTLPKLCPGGIAARTWRRSQFFRCPRSDSTPQGRSLRIFESGQMPVGARRRSGSKRCPRPPSRRRGAATSQAMGVAYRGVS